MPPPTDEIAPDLAPAASNGLLSRRRVIVCAGPGGVGKTTTSAALAIATARRGLKVAALTIDPARRLADSVGITDPGAEPREIPRERWARARDPDSGQVTMMMMDTKRTFDGLVERHAPSPEVRDRILNNPIYRQASSQLAGAHEFMAMEKLLELQQSGRFDCIVLDTPPTHDALDFLSAPERMIEALDSGFLRRVSKTLGPSRGLGSRLLERGASRVLAVMSHITGRELLGQVATFLTDLNALFGGFRARASAVSAAFRSPEFGFCVVCSPRTAAREEALVLLRDLHERGMAIDALIVNRVAAMPDSLSAGRAELEAACTQALAQQDEWTKPRLARLAGRLEQAHAEAQRKATFDAQQVAAMQSRLQLLGVRLPLVRVDELAADRVGLDAVLDVGEALEAEFLRTGLSALTRDADGLGSESPVGRPKNRTSDAPDSQ